MNSPPPYAPRCQSRPQDPETASIRSAAPSYISAAPSYTSMLPPSSTTTTSRPSGGLSSPYTKPSSLRSSSNTSVPSLHHFRASTTMHSTSLSHPKARHYHSVASRRATAQKIQEQSTLLLSALSGEDGIAQMKKRMEDEELERVKRTSEDPELVGELAAEENKRRRKEGLEDVLEKEDKRWDWLLTQMGD